MGVFSDCHPNKQVLHTQTPLYHTYRDLFIWFSLTQNELYSSSNHHPVLSPFHWSKQTWIDTKIQLITFFQSNRRDSKIFLICFFFSFWSCVATNNTNQIVPTCPIKKIHGSGNKRKKDSFSDYILRRIVVQIPVSSLIDTTNIEVGSIELERRFTKIDSPSRHDSTKL